MRHWVTPFWMAAALAACAERKATIDEPWTDVAVPAGAEVAYRGSVTSAKATDSALRWTFGDGGSNEGEVVAHVFATPGRYTLTLTAPDGSRSLEATRMLSAVPAPAAGNFALQLFGTGRDDADRVKIRIDDPSSARPGPPADIGSTDFTIEFWLRAEPNVNASGPVGCGPNADWINGNVILDRDRYSQDRKFGLSLAGGFPVFGVSGDGTGEVTLCSRTRVDDGTWHHVAVTRVRSTGALAMYVDGQPVAAQERGPAGDVSYPDAGKPGNHCNGPCVRSDPFLVIGAEKHDAGSAYPSFHGEVDELRLSDTLRYQGGFTRPTARFEPDGRTAALYHFDEGAGTLARDAATGAGGPSHGVLMVGGPSGGPMWVVSGAPTAAGP